VTTPLARNVRRIGHLDLPGGGQVVVQGNHAIVGHMKPVTRPQGGMARRPTACRRCGLDGCDFQFAPAPPVR
jgi:hypothetical protein